MDDASTLSHYLPQYCDATTGLPKSWLHFYFGIEWVNRERARRAISNASSSSLGMMPEDKQREWWQVQRNAAREE
jgi:hypothetical protein